MVQTPGTANPSMNCERCGHVNHFEEEDRGTEIFCARCGQNIMIPDSPAQDERCAWQFSSGAAQRGDWPLRNCLAADEIGRLYAAIKSSVIAIQEEEDGVRMLWEYRTGGVIPGSPARCADGSLRVHSDDGRLHAISAEGRALWPPVAVGKPLTSASPVVDSKGNTLVCASDGGLTRVDAAGHFPPTPVLEEPTLFDSTGVLWDNLFVVGAEDHFVHAVEIRGEKGIDVWSTGQRRGDTGWYVNSAPAVATGPIFVVAGVRSRLYGFAPDGSCVWETELAGQALGSPVVDGEDRVFLGLSSVEAGGNKFGKLACFDITQRDFLWYYNARGPVESTPVVGNDGTVYFGDNAGWIHAVSTDGEALWTYDSGCPVRSKGTLLSSGRVVFGNDSGGLVACRCDSTGLSRGWPKYMGSLNQTGQFPAANASS